MATSKNYRYCYWNCRTCNCGDDGIDVPRVRRAAYIHARRGSGHRVDGAVETTFTYGPHPNREEVQPLEDEEEQGDRCVLECGKRTKSGAACRRFIVGRYDGGETGSFWHSKLGTCDMRNSEWRCWQHEEVKESGKPESQPLG